MAELKGWQKVTLVIFNIAACFVVVGLYYFVADCLGLG